MIRKNILVLHSVLVPERIAMLKYGVEDIRHFYTNDVRFLKQFHHQKLRIAGLKGNSKLKGGPMMFVSYKWLQDYVDL